MHARKHASVLSADARIYLFRNFLSEGGGGSCSSSAGRLLKLLPFLHAAECDYIKNKATPRLARSGVVDAKTGKSKIDDIRTR
eukprot:1162013-Pelagomonas_calceolata.AAC.3